MFPTANSRVYFNEDGEPTGWDASDDYEAYDDDRTPDNDSECAEDHPCQDCEVSGDIWACSWCDRPCPSDAHGNTFPVGSLEWNAWNAGYDYARFNGNERENILSGEWAGDPLPNDIIRAVRSESAGDDPDDFNDWEDVAILDAWEEGYNAH